MAKKITKKTLRFAPKTSYLLNEKTPFVITESFRKLKASLSVSIPKKEGGISIMVTSSYPEDGKTTVSVNLALMFAMSSKAKVIIVDTDIRKGRISNFFDKNAVEGVSDYLSGQVSLEEVIRKTQEPNLDYITCGTTSPRPYELLESDEMRSLINELKKEYDYVIIDTPPLLLVSDALAIVSQADGVVVVCRHEVSYISDVNKILNKLAFAKANILGVVINDYDSREKLSTRADRYKYYSYCYDSTIELEQKKEEK